MNATNLKFIPADKFCTKVFDGTHDSPKAVQQGKPLVTSKHIKGSNVDLETTYNISQEDFDFINRRSRVSQWDVIVSMIGEYCGFCYIERSEKVEYAIKNVGVLRAENKLNAEWIYYYLNSTVGRAHLNSIRSGSSQPYLSLGGLRALPIIVPASDLAKRKITKVLATLDAKIELNNRINAELEAMAKLLYDYWFVQFDFPMTATQAAALGQAQLEGQPYKSSGGKMVFDPTLKREIPEGWEAGTLADIAHIVMGQSPPGESYNLSGEGSLFFQGSTDFGWRFPTARQFTTQPTRFAKEGDILLSVRAPVGTMNIAPQDCAIGRGLSALRSKSSHDTYLWSVMFYFKQIFDRRNTDGTTFGSINKDDLRSLQVVIPEAQVVESFETTVRAGNTMIATNQKQNQELTILRDWLLPMLMNGQVTVKG